MIGLLFAAALSVATPPGGVQADEAAAFEAMVRTHVLAADETFSGSSCADTKLEPVAVTPVKIGGQPEIVAWRQKVRATGCGRSVVHNLNIARVGASPPWRMTTGLPGDTLTDMQLQGSSVPSALAAAKVDLPPSCQSTKMREVYIGARPGGLDIFAPGEAIESGNEHRPKISLPDAAASMVGDMEFAKAWMEVWPFELCGQDRTLAVVFIPLRDQRRTYFLFTPIWRLVQTEGPGAMPKRAPAE
jgi:hypothetical protein